METTGVSDDEGPARGDSVHAGRSHMRHLHLHEQRRARRAKRVWMIPDVDYAPQQHGKARGCDCVMQGGWRGRARQSERGRNEEFPVPHMKGKNFRESCRRRRAPPSPAWRHTRLVIGGVLRPCGHAPWRGDAEGTRGGAGSLTHSRRESCGRPRWRRTLPLLPLPPPPTLPCPQRPPRRASRCATPS